MISYISEDKYIPSVKFQVTVNVEFAKLVDPSKDEWTTTTAYFNTRMRHLLDLQVNFSSAYGEGVQEIWTSCERYIRNGSGWVFRRITQVRLNIFRYAPVVGSSSSSYVKTPEWVERKQAVVNIQNKKDNECFKWSVLQCKYQNKVHPKSMNRVSSFNRKEWINSINWTGIEFPTSLYDIETFENKNKDWSVNVVQVYTEGKKIPAIVRQSKTNYQRKYELNLLLIVDEKSGKGHFAWLKHPNKLLKTNFNNSSKFCWNCMSTFQIRSTIAGHALDIARYQNHVKACIVNKPTKISFPQRKVMKFRNVQFIKRNEFSMSADFECLMRPPPPPPTPAKINGDGEEENISSLNILHTHKVFCFSLYVVSDRFQDQFPVKKYRQGEDGTDDAGYMFCKYLYHAISKINDLYKYQCNKKMKELTKQENDKFLEATHCHICRRELKCDMSFKSWKNLTKMNITDDPNDESRFYVDSSVLLGPRVRDHW